MKPLAVEHILKTIMAEPLVQRVTEEQIPRTCEVAGVEVKIRMLGAALGGMVRGPCVLIHTAEVGAAVTLHHISPVEEHPMLRQQPGIFRKESVSGHSPPRIHEDECVESRLAGKEVPHRGTALVERPLNVATAGKRVDASVVGHHAFVGGAVVARQQFEGSAQLLGLRPQVAGQLQAAVVVGGYQ